MYPYRENLDWFLFKVKIFLRKYLHLHIYMDF